MLLIGCDCPGKRRDKLLANQNCCCSDDGIDPTDGRIQEAEHHPANAIRQIQISIQT